MTPTFLHTMVRITDPERSRAFYEALGFTFDRDMDIVRNGEKEATNYFFSLGRSESVLELTYNHDGRTYELGTGYGHIAIGVDDLDSTLARLAEQVVDDERGDVALAATRVVGRPVVVWVSRALAPGAADRRLDLGQRERQRPISSMR